MYLKMFSTSVLEMLTNLSVFVWWKYCSKRIIDYLGLFLMNTNGVALTLCPQEHFNYYSLDSSLGHLVFSIKYDEIGDQEHLRLMLR